MSDTPNISSMDQAVVMHEFAKVGAPRNFDKDSTRLDPGPGTLIPLGLFLAGLALWMRHKYTEVLNGMDAPIVEANAARKPGAKIFYDGDKKGHY